MKREDDTPQEWNRTVTSSSSEVDAAVTEIAEAWGAEWEVSSGRLALPLSAGLWRGWGEGSLRVSARGSGSEIRLRLDSRHFGVRWSAVFVLVIAALGCLFAVLWPLFPQLLPLAPVGVVLALSAWFLVLSKLTNSGPEDFLEAIVRELEIGERESPAGV